MKPKILFTSPCGPYPKLPVDKDPIDYFYYRNTYKQKVFQLRSFQSWHSLHFLAQNIPVESVVLENPNMRTFKKEIEKGEYAIVSIGFTILLTKKVLEMVEWLKQTYPSIEIILGGYGTAVFNESFETSDRLKSLVNFICYGEGLGFINSIIKNKWNIENHLTLKQELLPARNSLFRTRIELFKQIVLVKGLGCVYGCSFCATSSQFNKNYVPLFKGKQFFNSLLEQSNKYPKIQSAIIYDEDFLLNRKSALEFRSYYKNSKLYKKSFLLTIFASVKSILKYKIEELIECGIGTIFIGIESFSDEVLIKEGLLKRKGEIEALFEKLHKHGINTLGSLIIGWDSQSLKMAATDSNHFISINPTFYQVVPLHIVPGTKLWENMKNDGRIIVDYKVELDGIANFNFKTKNFSHREALKIVFSTYSGLVKEGGPWPFRMFENVLRGHINLKGHKNPSFRNRAKIYESMIFPLCIIAFSSRFFFRGEGFKNRWALKMNTFLKTFPFLFSLSLLLSPILICVLSIIYFSANLLYFINPKGDQPQYIRKHYFA